MSTTAPKLRRVLFVDDDATFLELMKELAGTLSAGQWEILTAQSTSKALAALQEQPVDLAVIDVQMPVMDGIQMLSLLNRSYPNLQKVALTGFANDKYRAACLSSGAELFLEKPNTQDEWQSLFATLNELLKVRPAQDFRGVLRRVELAEVVQVQCTEKSSSVLTVTSEGGEGRIYIKAGALLHAVAGERKGQAALDFLLSLRGGEFKLAPFAEPPEKSLKGSWEALLLRASQAREPAPAPKPELPSQTAPRFPTPPSTLPPPPGSSSGAAPTETNRPQVEEVLICSAQGDVLYEWQCRDAELWIKFLEFLSQKAQRLAEGIALGEFNRLEIQTHEARIVVIVSPDRGVVVRTRRQPSAIGAAGVRRIQPGTRGPGTDEEAKEQAAGWLRRAPLARGVLVRGIRFADQTVACDMHSRDFPMAVLEQAFRAVADTCAVLTAHQLPPTRLIWLYGRAALHCVRRDDGAIFGTFVSPKAEAADLATLDRLLSEFRELELGPG